MSNKKFISHTRLSFYFICFLLGLLLVNQIVNKAFGDIIKIVSNPDKASVSVRALNGTEFKKAGETPFEMSAATLKSNFSLGEIFILRIEKEGHEADQYITADIGKADFELTTNLKVKSQFDDAKLIDKSITSLFEAQRLIRSKNYEQALKILSSLQENVPTLSTIKEFIGMTYYVQGKYKESLDAYTAAYTTNPENLDSLKMITYIKKLLGIKSVEERPGKIQ